MYCMYNYINIEFVYKYMNIVPYFLNNVDTLQIIEIKLK